MEYGDGSCVSFYFVYETQEPSPYSTAEESFFKGIIDVKQKTGEPFLPDTDNPLIRFLFILYYPFLLFNGGSSKSEPFIISGPVLSLLQQVWSMYTGSRSLSQVRLVEERKGRS